MNTTENKELAKLEEANAGDATKIVRSNYLKNLEKRSSVSDKLVDEVTEAFGHQDRAAAQVHARLLVLENPGKLA